MDLPDLPVALLRSRLFNVNQRLEVVRAERAALEREWDGLQAERLELEAEIEVKQAYTPPRRPHV